jgi:hypothetical protein
MPAAFMSAFSTSIGPQQGCGPGRIRSGSARGRSSAAPQNSGILRTPYQRTNLILCPSQRRIHLALAASRRIYRYLSSVRTSAKKGGAAAGSSPIFSLIAVRSVSIAAPLTHK